MRVGSKNAPMGREEGDPEAAPGTAAAALTGGVAVVADSSAPTGMACRARLRTTAAIVTPKGRMARDERVGLVKLIPRAPLLEAGFARGPAGGLRQRQFRSAGPPCQRLECPGKARRPGVARGAACL